MYSVTVYMYGSELLTMQIWYEYLVLHSTKTLDQVYKIIYTSIIQYSMPSSWYDIRYDTVYTGAVTELRVCME